MAVIPLAAQKREGVGKGPARRARREGWIPCVLYGHGEPPLAVAVVARDLDLALRGREGANPIVGLKLGAAASERTALIRAVQRDPVTHEIVHIDFQHISLTERIEVNVAVRLTGAAVGVKEAGGILETITRELKVRCLPTAIPGHVDVDVSALTIGDSIHVRDLTVPGVEILTDSDATIATVVPPTVIEEKAPEVAAPEVPAEPELITKGKKEEAEPEAVEKKPAEKEKKPPEKKVAEKK